MSRDNSPLHRRGAVILGLIQPRCALSRSWSRCLILRCVAVTSQRGFMLAIVATPSFLKRTSMTVCQVGNHGPIGDSWPIAFLGCPRGHRVPQRLVHEAHWPNFRFDTLSRTRASQEPDWH